MEYFQDIIRKLQDFWALRGANILFPYDEMMGAGTFHPATFFNALSDEPYSCCYVQPSRRPKDGRYGENPNRWQKYYQMQVLVHPSPENILAEYRESLKAISIDVEKHDLKLMEDDWESPTLGAWGLGWEVWLDGLEITQFTYFRQVGGITLKRTPVEITYGLERLAMFIQEKKSIAEIEWSPGLLYGTVHLEEEKDCSFYNFKHSDPKALFQLYEIYESEAHRLLKLDNIFSAYENMLRCSHTFNLLDARGVISVTQRANYIKKIRAIASALAKAYRKRNGKDGNKG